MNAANEKIEDRGSKIDARTGTPSSRLHLLSSILFLLPSLVLLPTALGGCVPIAALASKVVPPPAVPARYVPDKTKPILVLVENYRNPDAGRLDAQRVTIHVADELKRYGVAPVISPDDAEALRSRADYRGMKVQEVGRAAGALQVLYVNLRPVGVDNMVAGEMLKARVEMRVRIVDVESGQTLWPRDTPEGEALVVESPWTRSQAGDREGAHEMAMRDKLARTAASQIVRLFRKWQPDEEEHDLGETVQ